MASTSDVILAIAVVAGLGLLIYAGEKLAQWSAGVEKGLASWETQQAQQSGVGPWSLSTAMPNVNFILWGLPAKEESAISSWFSGVEKRLEKGLTTWW